MGTSAGVDRSAERLALVDIRVYRSRNQTARGPRKTHCCDMVSAILRPALFRPLMPRSITKIDRSAEELSCFDTQGGAQLAALAELTLG
jgi:hypothetical protein